MALPIKKQIDYALFLAAGQDDPHSVTITELCATIARLQEQVETLRKERDTCARAATMSAKIGLENSARAEAAEAERDRLRELLAQAKTALGPRKFPKLWLRIDAALQKEPQP